MNLLKIILAFLLPCFNSYNQKWKVNPFIDAVYYEAKPAQVSMHWKNKLAVPYRAFSSLFYENPKLTFATNAGMFGADLDNPPLGLYIENGKRLRPVRRVTNPKYNFGMQPQGVFLITKDNVAKVVTVDNPAVQAENIKYATQSAPMLVIGSKINPKLTTSASRNRRNGVGVMKSGNVVLIYSPEPVTFRQFAQLFIDRGCTSAMYLDGAISNALYRSEQAWDGCECYGPFIGISN